MSEVSSTVPAVDIRTWTAAEWAAFGAVGALVVYVVLGVIALRQLRETRRLRELEYRPYVTVDFVTDGFVVKLEVKNTGKTPAREVTVRFDQPLQAAPDRRAPNFSLFDSPIPLLAPGRSFRITMGTGPAYFAEGVNLPLTYQVEVEYWDLRLKDKYADPPYPLDLRPHQHTALTMDPMKDMASSLKDMRQLFKGWSSNDGMRVNASDRHSAEKRRDRVDHWFDMRHSFERGGVRAVLKDEAQRLRRWFR